MKDHAEDPRLSEDLRFCSLWPPCFFRPSSYRQYLPEVPYVLETLSSEGSGLVLVIYLKKKKSWLNWGNIVFKIFIHQNRNIHCIARTDAETVIL